MHKPDRTVLLAGWCDAAVKRGADLELRLELKTAAGTLGRLSPVSRCPISPEEASGKLRRCAAKLTEFAASAGPADSSPTAKTEQGNGATELGTPELPLSIREIPNAELRWQAGRTWQAASDLIDCIQGYHRLTVRLETGADVSLPEWEKLYDKAGRAANVLCDTGATPEEVTPLQIIEQFPKRQTQFPAGKRNATWTRCD